MIHPLEVTFTSSLAVKMHFLPMFSSCLGYELSVALTPSVINASAPIMAYHLHRPPKDRAKPRPHRAVIITQVMDDRLGS